jgi:hypothetical protein
MAEIALLIARRSMPLRPFLGIRKGQRRLFTAVIIVSINMEDFVARA